MNFRNISISFVIPLLIISIISCSSQKTEWQGTIEEVDGVTVVKNPKEPMYGSEVFNIEEEISIGKKEGREEYLFSEIQVLSVDEQENIYVLDKKEPFIRVFGADASFSHVIGKKGQGPGELQWPTEIQVTPSGELAVYDKGNKRLTFYDLDGKYLRQFSSAALPSTWEMKIDSKNQFFGVFMTRDSYGLNKYDAGLDSAQLLIIVNVKEYVVWGEWSMQPYIYFDLTKTDQIVCGSSDKYELLIINSDGKILKKVTKKNYDPIKVSGSVKEDYINRLTKGRGILEGERWNLLEYFFLFAYFSVDDEGRIIVGTYEAVETKPGFYYFDVFDHSGKYVAKIPLKVWPNKRHWWKKSKLYTIEEDEDGYQYAKRYNVTWNY